MTLHVLVDVHTGLDRCGVEPGEAAVDLARAVSKAQNLRFAGLMTYEGAILKEDLNEAAAESRKWIQLVLDTRETVEKGGLAVEVVSVGGTHNYEIAGAMPGVTEVPAGAYALMDYRYRQRRPQFRPAAKVMATVISRPEAGLALLDTGQKAIGADTGVPVVEDLPGATLTRMSAEHGFLALEGEAQGRAALGAKVWLTPRAIGNCINVYDYISAVRGGLLEAVWDVTARGRYR